jgi:membrane-bound lytic murein transglycosylase D
MRLVQSHRYTSRLLALRLLLLSLLCSFTMQAQISKSAKEDQVRPKMLQLNKQSPIALDYNSHVQAYIDVYTVKRRDHLARIIGRSEVYFPLFEAYLDKYGLPLELKYLAIVESALDPKAKSTSAAMGLWQFLYHTSQMFDLQVTSFVDERCDPAKSTEAACKYLQYLYRNFNDWHLALAAYNVGVGEVKKAIEKTGKTRFWDLAPHLPEQARGYVPAFIAANYVMENYADYHIEMVKPKYAFADLDSVWVEKSMTFDQIAKASGLSIEDISALNPQYTKNFVPVLASPVRIVLPAVNVALFMREAKKLPEAATPQAMSMLMPQRTNKITHTVARGEFFHKIAMQYHCNIEDIMGWNKLTSKNLMAGQKLTIWVSPSTERYFFVKSEVDDALFISQQETAPLIADHLIRQQQ